MKLRPNKLVATKLFSVSMSPVKLAGLIEIAGLN